MLGTVRMILSPSSDSSPKTQRCKRHNRSSNQPKQQLEDQAGASPAAKDFAAPSLPVFGLLQSSKGQSLKARVNVAGLKVWVRPQGLVQIQLQPVVFGAEPSLEEVQSQPGEQGGEDGDMLITQSWPP